MEFFDWNRKTQKWSPKVDFLDKKQPPLFGFKIGSQNIQKRDQK